MKNPLFYLSAFAVCLFFPTPAKAKNLTPDFSEETVTDNTSPRQVLQRNGSRYNAGNPRNALPREPPQRTGSPNPSPYKGEGSVDLRQRGGEVISTDAISDQTKADSLSLEERLKSLPISEASRGDLRERLIEYQEAIKSGKPLSYKEKGFNSPLPSEVQVLGG